MVMPRPIGRFGPRTFAILGLLTFFNVNVEAGNTTCAGNLTDWYTNAVGETACETYQQLRQICDRNYQVPSFRPNTPGDNCNDQLADCCCNSIAWSLSMICMNCQWDVNGSSPAGIDAGVGAYGLYRTSPSGTFCNPNTNNSLPTGIQTAVCNAGIKLSNFLYDLFWNDGSWFFYYTQEHAGEEQVQYNNDTFTHCNSSSTTSSTTTLTTSYITQSVSSTTASPSPSSSHANTASVVGGVVGSIAGLALILGASFIYWKKRNYGQVLPKTNGNGGTISAVTPHTLTSLDDSVLPSSGMTQQTRHRPDSSPRAGSALDSGAAYPSQGVSDVVLSNPPIERVQHEDLGPLTMLERSASGSLPPAYNPQWGSAPRTQARPLPQPTNTGAARPPTVPQPQLK